MTTLHAEKRKTQHFPKKQHFSTSANELEWLLGSDAAISTVRVSDDNHTIDIDISAPGSKSRGGHREELIDIVFPKNTK